MRLYPHSCFNKTMNLIHNKNGFRVKVFWEGGFVTQRVVCRNKWPCSRKISCLPNSPCPLVNWNGSFVHCIQACRTTYRAQMKQVLTRRQTTSGVKDFLETANTVPQTHRKRQNLHVDAYLNDFGVNSYLAAILFSWTRYAKRSIFNVTFTVHYQYAALLSLLMSKTVYFIHELVAELPSLAPPFGYITQR